MGVSGNLSQEVYAESHYAQDQRVPSDTGILYFPFFSVESSIILWQLATR